MFEPTSSTKDFEVTLKALRKIRAPYAEFERQLYPLIEQALQVENIAYSAEVRLGPRARIDFLTAGGTGIEVKKGRPNREQIIGQLERYCSFEKLKSLVVVVPWQKNLHLPHFIQGKSVAILSLNRLWGISL